MIQNVQILPRNETYWQDNEWKKLLSEAISSPEQLLSLVGLDINQLPYTLDNTPKFIQKVPTPYIERMTLSDPYDPLLLQVLSLAEESVLKNGFSQDPLSEHSSALPGLLHKYNSRVLVMLATSCAINCRYCFRREFPYKDNQLGKAGKEQILHYLTQHPEVNEVILSGGDPLMVNDKVLAEFLHSLSTINTVKRVRIHTRLPLVIPQRITESLVKLLQSTPLQTVMVLHINHPNEIDKTFSRAMYRLHKAGVSLLNQSVLLKGINDNVETLSLLSEKLFDTHILPYYIHLLDKVKGAHHFEVDEKEAKIIIKKLQQNVAGFLVPKLVREIGGEKSKTLINLHESNQ